MNFENPEKKETLLSVEEMHNIMKESGLTKQEILEAYNLLTTEDPADFGEGEIHEGEPEMVEIKVEDEEAE